MKDEEDKIVDRSRLHCIAAICAAWQCLFARARKLDPDLDGRRDVRFPDQRLFHRPADCGVLRGVLGHFAARGQG